MKWAVLLLGALVSFSLVITGIYGYLNEKPDPGLWVIIGLITLLFTVFGADSIGKL